VIAAVDVERLASDQFGGVMRQERGRNADIVDAHEAAGGAFFLIFSNNAANSGMPEAARVAG
jgi:hypothetical protein